MSNRVVPVAGGLLAVGAGYYFYKAGGDPKVAQKKLEADAAKVSHEVRDHIPGSAKELKKDAESAKAQAESKFNQLTRDAKAEANKVDNKIGQMSNDASRQLGQMQNDASRQLDAAGKEINKGINKFDNTVEQEASKAKSGLSGWFGGK